MMRRVLQIMQTVFGVPVLSLSTIDTVEEWDSLKHMELVMALEDEFGFTFDDEEIPEITTVERIVQAVTTHAG